MAAEEPALTRPVDPDDIGKYAKFDGTDVVWDTPAGGGGVGTPGLVGDLSAIEIGDAATAGATGRYADAAHQHALAAPAAPAALGASAATGAATMPARADHVHPYPTAAQVGAATTAHAHAGVYDPAGTAAAAVAAHDADTSVHGIPDTSALLDTGDIGVSVQGYSAVLAATTASFTTADEAKLDGIEASADVTDETNVVAALSGATLTDLGTPASGDKVLLLDASDSDNLKVAQFSTFGGGSGTFSVMWVYPASQPTGRYLVSPSPQVTTKAVSTNGDSGASLIQLAGSTTFDRIGVHVTTAVSGATVRLGIYADSVNRPAALVLDAGTVDASSTGYKEITISQTLSAGVYWLAAAAQGAVGNIAWVAFSLTGNFAYGFSSMSSLSGITNVGMGLASTPGAFPSTIVATPGTDKAPMISLRVA